MNKQGKKLFNYSQLARFAGQNAARLRAQNFHQIVPAEINAGSSQLIALTRLLAQLTAQELITQKSKKGRGK